MAGTVFYNSADNLGEAPTWLASQQQILWVDINANLLHCVDYQTSVHSSFTFEKPITSIIPYIDAKVWLTMSDELICFDIATSQIIHRRALSFIEDGYRTNDAKASPDGALWIGVMNKSDYNGTGALYRISRDGEFKLMLDKQSIPNGMVWNKSTGHMFYIDSGRGVIEEYSFDSDSSELILIKTLVQVPQDMGLPDGMTIDSDGNLWVAHWGGAMVCAWDSTTGDLLNRVQLPAINTSACTFGADNKLFVSSAIVGASDDDMTTYSNNGALFEVKTNVEGGENHYPFVPEFIQ